MCEYDSITASHKHRKHSSVMVIVVDNKEIWVKSLVKSKIFFVNFSLLDLSN